MTHICVLYCFSFSSVTSVYFYTLIFLCCCNKYSHVKWVSVYKVTKRGKLFKPSQVWHVQCWLVCCWRGGGGGFTRISKFSNTALGNHVLTRNSEKTPLKFIFHSLKKVSSTLLMSRVRLTKDTVLFINWQLNVESSVLCLQQLSIECQMRPLWRSFLCGGIHFFNKLPDCTSVIQCFKNPTANVSVLTSSNITI